MMIVGNQQEKKRELPRFSHRYNVTASQGRTINVIISGIAATTIQWTKKKCERNENTKIRRKKKKRRLKLWQTISRQYNVMCILHTHTLNIFVRTKRSRLICALQIDTDHKSLSHASKTGYIRQTIQGRKKSHRKTKSTIASVLFCCLWSHLFSCTCAGTLTERSCCYRTENSWKCSYQLCHRQMKEYS